PGGRRISRPARRRRSREREPARSRPTRRCGRAPRVADPPAVRGRDRRVAPGAAGAGRAESVTAQRRPAARRDGLRIIVTGLVAQHARLGGVAWDYLQYVLGLHRLGHDVFYLEDSGEWPYALTPQAGDWAA